MNVVSYLENSHLTKVAPIISRELKKKKVNIRPYQVRRCLASARYAHENFPHVDDEKWQKLLEFLNPSSSQYDKWVEKRDTIDLEL